jgi:enolase-phosphatase E1
MIKAIVTDIEGTTSSIEFVHQSLFPYARAHLRRFLREQAGDPQVQSLIDRKSVV